MLATRMVNKTHTSDMLEIKAVRLTNGSGLPLPQAQADDSPGLDLFAAVPQTTPIRLLPGMKNSIPTGLSIEIPMGYEGQVRPRADLALNQGITVLNAPATISAADRSEIKVLLINLGRETVIITRGQRIAYLVIAPVARAELVDARGVHAAAAAAGPRGVVKAQPRDNPSAPAPAAAVAVTSASNAKHATRKSTTQNGKAAIALAGSGTAAKGQTTKNTGSKINRSAVKPKTSPRT